MTEKGVSLNDIWDIITRKTRLKGVETIDWKKEASLFADFAPGVGDVKSAIEAATGKDYITGEKLSKLGRVSAGVGVLPFVPGIFKGVKGKHAKRLDKARESFRKGESMENIRQDTGWFFRTEDGKWRFEIDDSKMEFHPKFNKSKIKLDDVVTHDELFEAYPELRDIRIKRDLRPGQGSYNESEGVIHISRQDVSKENIIHEVQHAVQGIEDFARGGSPIKMKGRQAYLDLPGEKEARESAFRRFLDKKGRRQIPPDSMR